MIAAITVAVLWQHNNTSSTSVVATCWGVQIVYVNYQPASQHTKTAMDTHTLCLTVCDSAVVIVCVGAALIGRLSTVWQWATVTVLRGVEAPGRTLRQRTDPVQRTVRLRRRCL